MTMQPIRTTSGARLRRRGVVGPARRRGVASMLAMLFLVLFSVMALGFFATTTMSVQISGNEQRSARAMTAAESGLQFVRYHLWDLTIPPLTPEEDLMDQVYLQLSGRLDGRPNLQGAVVEMPDADTIVLPGGDGYIPTDGDGGGFRAIFKRAGKKVQVTCIGVLQTTENGVTMAKSARGIQLDFDVAEKATSIFDYGLAARGRIATGGASWVKGATDSSKGSVMSAFIDPVSPTVTLDGKGISGSVSYMAGSAKPSIDGSVGGTTDQVEIWESHVKELEEAPMFPVVDTALFEKYATGTYNSSNSVHQNVRLEKGKSYSFSGGKIQGVLYIESPCTVTFSGNVEIQGVIVVEPNPDDGAVSQLGFSGSTKVSGVESLPSDSKFDGLRELTGSFILAPDTHVDMKGNFGTVNGSVIADKVSITGNTTATVKGTLISLDPDEPMTVWGSGEVIIASTGTSNYPAGLRFGEHYYPVPGSYREVRP